MTKKLTPEEQELFDIYHKANNLDPKRHNSITTERIFNAMRAMRKLDEKKATWPTSTNGRCDECGDILTECWCGISNVQ